FQAEDGIRDDLVTGVQTCALPIWRCALRKKIVPTWAFTLLTLVVIALLFSAGNSAANEDQPTIAKDSVQVTAFTFSVYKKNYDRSEERRVGKESKARRSQNSTRKQ